MDVRKCRPHSHHPLQLILSPSTSLPLRPWLTKSVFKPFRRQEEKTMVSEKIKLEIGLLLMSLEDRAS